MRVFDSIKNKNIDEFVDWLDENCDPNFAPWWKWWDENYCDKCERIESETTNFFGYKMEYAYCELNSNCRFFKDRKDMPNSKQVIKMWLESEAPNDEADDTVMCRDCKYMMYSDCNGECSQSYKGIVMPYDSCEYGERRNTEEKK